MTQLITGSSFDYREDDFHIGDYHSSDLNRMWGECLIGYDDAQVASVDSVYLACDNGTEDYYFRIVCDDSYYYLPMDDVVTEIEYGYYNCKPNCFFIQKLLARHWRLGLHNNNTTVEPATQTEAHSIHQYIEFGGNKQHVRNYRLFDLFEKIKPFEKVRKFYTYSEAVMLIRSTEWQSVALSPEIALVARPYDNSLELVYNRMLVGLIDPFTNNLRLATKYEWLEDSIMEVLK